MSYELTMTDGVRAHMKKIELHVFPFCLTMVRWSKDNIDDMIKAQKQLTEYLVLSNFIIDDKAKDAFRQLHDDMISYNVSICSVCRDKEIYRPYVNVEHLEMETTWGYTSEKHNLTLCYKCYDEYILKGSLGNYVKITEVDP